MLAKDQALEKLQRQLDRISEIRTKTGSSPEFTKWKRDTEVAIEQIFGNKTRHLKDFKDIGYSLMVFTTSTPDSAFVEAFRDGLDEAVAILKSFIDEIKEYRNDKVPASSTLNPASKIGHLCNRFHLLAKQLCSRIWKSRHAQHIG